MTREELRDMTREFADAVDSPRWSDASVDQLMSLAQWQELGGLLNANRKYYMNSVDVTLDSDGRFDIADLTTGTGNDVKNFYRILTLAQPNNSSATAQLYYREVDYEEYPNPQPSTSLPYVWYRFGDQIQVLPAQAGLTMRVVCNYRPCRIADLDDDADNVPFPDGYEALIAYVAAAGMLDKGGQEAGAANVQLANAESVRDAMLLDLGRMSTKPTIARSFDDPLAWGG